MFYLSLMQCLVKHVKIIYLLEEFSLDKLFNWKIINKIIKKSQNM